MYVESHKSQINFDVCMAYVHTYTTLHAMIAKDFDIFSRLSKMSMKIIIMTKLSAHRFS